MKELFKGRQYPYEIIKEAVVMYCHYSLSYRECAELLAYYLINVDHTTIYRWVSTLWKNSLWSVEETTSETTIYGFMAHGRNLRED